MSPAAKKPPPRSKSTPPGSRPARPGSKPSPVQGAKPQVDKRVPKSGAKPAAKLSPAQGAKPQGAKRVPKSSATPTAKLSPAQGARPQGGKRVPKRAKVETTPATKPSPAPGAKPQGGKRVPKRAKVEATPVAERAPPPAAAAAEKGETVGVEVEPGRIEESLKRAAGELRHWANKGRYTRVRFKFRGRPLLPDLPLAAVLAAEGLSFYWAGILRALIVNVAGRAVFEVELVNESEKKVQLGKEALLSGELDRALELFGEAARMDRDSAPAQLNMGVALRLRGEEAKARAALEQAKKLDPLGPHGAEADRLLASIAPRGP